MPRKVEVGGKGGVTLMGTDFFWGEENILKFLWGWLHSSVIILKAIELYIING